MNHCMYCLSSSDIFHPVQNNQTLSLKELRFFLAALAASISACEQCCGQNQQTDVWHCVVQIVHHCSLERIVQPMEPGLVSTETGAGMTDRFESR